MHAPVRICRYLSALLLFIMAPQDFAQPATATNAGTGSTNLVPVQRRFQRATTQTLATNNPAPATAFPVAPVAPPPRPRRTNLTTAATATNIALPPTNNVIVGAPNAAIIDQTTIERAETVTSETVVLPSPAAAQGTNAVLVPGTDRVAIPIPAPETAVPTDAELDAADSAISTNPLNPALNPLDPVAEGALALNNMPLEQFFDVYSRYSGRTVLRPVALPAQGLTLKAATELTRREVIDAMDAVLALNGVTMIPVGDRFVKAVLSTLAHTEGAEISTVPADQLAYSEQFITRIVKLKTAKPTEIAPHLQGLAKTPTAVTPIDSNQTLILRDYSSNIKRMLEIIEKIDVMPESDFTLEVIPIRYGKVGDIHATMNALISGAGGGAGGGVATTTAGGAGALGRTGGFGTGGMGGGGSRFGGMGGSSRSGGGYGGGNYGGGGGGYGGGNYRGGGGGGGYYPYEMPNGEVTPQQVATPGAPGAAQGSFQNRLNQIVNRAANPDEVKILENAQIVPDERSNKLLIFANKRDMAMITNIVSKVDVLLAQVLIEAIIMEVKIGDSLNVGVSAAQHPRQLTGDLRGAGTMLNGNGQFLSALTNFPSGPEGFNYFATINDDFDVAIQAIARDSEIKIVSRPRIHTSHAMPGFFFIGETVPYVTGSIDYGGLGTVGTRSQVTERQVGLTLEVTPIITPEGMVIMEITQDFQQRGQDVIIDGNPIPLVNSRTASSFLTVRDGDLIMLGGFISETRSKSKGGVPFLKDIPGLGVLFRSSAKSNDRTELILLIKATVLQSPEEAAFLAENERLILPGIRQAEQEFQKSDNKRLQKAEKRGKR